MFALVDCNNFYVSCELVFAPNLIGKPVVVLSNNDGCVISRSNEAKKIGFKMGEPIFKRKDLVKRHNVTVFSSNYTLYGDMSTRIQDTLSLFSPKSEIYSIDESFLLLDHIPSQQLIKYAETIKNTVEKNTGIPVSIGMGTTKTLAKIANKVAKNSSCHNGIFLIDGERRTHTVLRNTPICDIWGIGRQYAKLMEKNHLFSAFDFTKTNDHWIKSHMSVMGLRIKKELLGTSCLPIESIIKSKKAIATTRAFGQKTTDIKIIREAVATYATRCSEKLRKQHCVTNLVTVFIHSDPFNPSEKYKYFGKSYGLPVPSSSQPILVKHALFLLNEIFQEGIKYKKAGVIIEGLEPDTSIQGSLFDDMDIKKLNSISKTTDLVNQKYGKDTLKLSIQGDGKKWQLRQEKLSKKYTTKLEDIITINTNKS